MKERQKGLACWCLAQEKTLAWRLSFKMAGVFKGRGGRHGAVTWSPLPSPDNSQPQTQGTGAVAGLVYRPWMELLLSSPQLGQNRWGEHAIRWIITHCWCGGFSSSRATSKLSWLQVILYYYVHLYKSKKRDKCVDLVGFRVKQNILTKGRFVNEYVLTDISRVSFFLLAFLHD